jgi:hypothetical protein
MSQNSSCVWPRSPVYVPEVFGSMSQKPWTFLSPFSAATGKHCPYIPPVPLYAEMVSCNKKHQLGPRASFHSLVDFAVVWSFHHTSSCTVHSMDNSLQSVLSVHTHVQYTYCLILLNCMIPMHCTGGVCVCVCVCTTENLLHSSVGGKVWGRGKGHE